MFIETFIVVSLLVCPIVYYISTKNKREKIDFHGKHIGKLGITMIHLLNLITLLNVITSNHWWKFRNWLGIMH